MNVLSDSSEFNEKNVPAGPTSMPTRRKRVVRSRTGILCITLLLLSLLVGATSLTDVSTNYLDLAKILSVISFVGAMIALAVGMVGDCYRS